MNIFGRHFRVISFGESHGPACGTIIDGCPAGVLFSMSALQYQLNRRKPGRFDWQTSRKEPDCPLILSGIFENKTLGTPIAVIVMNQDAKPKDYEKIEQRQGHADDLWKEKFKHYDPRGGGRASGRETLSRVIGGAIAQMFLKQINKNFQILSYSTQIGPYQLEVDESQKLEEYASCFPQKSDKIKQLLISAKKEGQSYGGKAKIKIKKIPKGLGQPVFNKLKSDLAGALVGIGAVFGISIGCSLQNFETEGKNFHQNPKNYGGIRGGISTGENIELELYFKPPSSLGEIAKKGRHDPCIIPRALPVLEAMVHLVIADHVLAKRLDHI